jgi:UDP-glucose 4-epimerase
MNTAGRTIRRVRAVVTGGAGFIGSHVVDALLARGDEVHVVDDLSTGKREYVAAGAELHEADIRRDVDRVFDEVAPELCFHLAAQADVRVSVERPDHDADVNVIGTLRVLEASRRHNTKIVFSSTGGAIYGECDGPAREDHPRLPLAPYGVSKLAGEEYLAAYNRLYGSEHVSLRYGNVYGPHQDPKGEAGVVAIFMNRLRDGETPRIFGDGKQTRDYTYVGDIVAANLVAAERGAPDGVYNIGTGTESSVLEVLNAVREAAGLSEDEAEPEFRPERLGELQRSSLDVAKAREQLGFTADTTLAEGMAPTLEWARTAVAAG